MTGRRRSLMGRKKCMTCMHPERVAIDLELAAGASPTKLARKYGQTSPDSVRKHAVNHLGWLLEAALRGDYDGDTSRIRSVSTVQYYPPEEA